MHVRLQMLSFLATVAKPLMGSADGEVGAPGDEPHSCSVWTTVRCSHPCRCPATGLPPPVPEPACMEEGGRWAPTLPGGLLPRHPRSSGLLSKYNESSLP